LNALIRVAYLLRLFDGAPPFPKTIEEVWANYQWAKDHGFIVD